MTTPTEDIATLISFADMIDNRVGPIAGRDADTIALMMRRVAVNVTALSDALTAMVDRWEPDATGTDRAMWEAACRALGRGGFDELPLGQSASAILASSDRARPSVGLHRLQRLLVAVARVAAPGWVAQMTFDFIDRKFAPMPAAPEAPKTPWWCDDCQKEIDGCEVTYEERHDERYGGCGCNVYSSCARCGNGGWEAYGLGHHDLHMRECPGCGNPNKVPCP